MTPAQDLIRHYRWLRRYGLNDSHSGNASIRAGDRVWITPTGACADVLAVHDLVECDRDAPPPPAASLDAALHLAVYRANPETAAVLHSHGPYSVALTLDGADFEPPDFEGSYYFGRVPVLSIPYDRYIDHSPTQVADTLRTHPVTVVRGHGVYAAARTMNLAYKWTCTLEQSAKTAWLARMAGTVAPD